MYTIMGVGVIMLLIQLILTMWCTFMGKYYFHPTKTHRNVYKTLAWVMDLFDTKAAKVDDRMQRLRTTSKMYLDFKAQNYMHMRSVISAQSRKCSTTLQPPGTPEPSSMYKYGRKHSRRYSTTI